MKVTVDGVDILELSKVQEDIIKHEIPSEIFEDDMIRRLKWIVMRKHEQAFKKMKEEWDHKLEKAGVEFIPTNPDEYAKLVFSQPDYQDKDSRAQ